MKQEYGKKICSTLICCSLLITAVPMGNSVISEAQVVQSQTADYIEQHSLHRVDEVTDQGLIRSYLEDAQGDVYTEDSHTEDNSLVDRLISKKAESLPTSYDLRDYGMTTPIKDQGVGGACWSFGAVKSMESNALMTGMAVGEPDYSESHLAWFAYHPSMDTSDPMYQDGLSIASTEGSTAAYDYGGSALLAMFNLAPWSGAAKESVAPYQADTSSELNSMSATMATSESLRYVSSAHMQNAEWLDDYMVQDQGYYYNNVNTIIPEIKQSVMEHGAMDISVYFDSSYIKKTTGGGTSYCQTRYTTPSTAVNNANHCITVVGWDDNYAASNFKKAPSKGNGAWLIANSYGDDYGDAGYFWLSYYDKSICDCVSFQVESADNYNHIYQYDGGGWGDVIADRVTMKEGNIFTAQQDAAQQVSAVSFYTVENDQSFTIQVYRDIPEDASDPTAGQLISDCTISETESYSGYHTVNLAQPVSVEAGERFGIVVSYLSSNSQMVYLPVEGTTQTSEDYLLTQDYSSDQGQSFLYIDTTDGGGDYQWVDSSKYGYNNVCVKAFAQDTEKADVLPTADPTLMTATPDPQQTDSAIEQPTPTTQVGTGGQGYVTAVPSDGPYTSLSPVVSVSPSPSPTATAKVAGTTSTSTVKKGQKLTKGKLIYQITSVQSGKRSVTLKGTTSRTITSVKIPARIVWKGQYYKVTAISSGALARCSRLKKVTIGSQVNRIGRKAFYRCRHLNRLVIRSRKLTQKKTGAKAFTTGCQKGHVSVPKERSSQYRKLLKVRGLMYYI